MNEADGVLLPRGGYEKLRSYKVAEAVYDATVVFCDRFIDKRSRTHDQMVQPARSGVRNISEGSDAADTSRKTEIKLTNVARASLSDELLKASALPNKAAAQERHFGSAAATRNAKAHDRWNRGPLSPLSSTPAQRLPGGC